MPGLSVRLEADHLRVGEHFSLTLQRTIRLPDDGREYPLTPAFGEFPIVELALHSARLPKAWDVPHAFLVPMYEREALFLAFAGAEWKPNAVQVGAGGINAISGGGWPEPPKANPQNYVVCPDQPWLDGIYAQEGRVRQFIAAPRGRGDTIAEQLGGAEPSALQVRVYEARPGKFPDQPPPREQSRFDSMMPSELGVAAGGAMRQKVYPDPYGVDTWDPEKFEQVHLFLVSPDVFRDLTGREPPPPSITAETYTHLNLPWFELDDSDASTLTPTDKLGEVESLSERERRRGDEGADDESVEINPEQIDRIPRKRKPK